MDKALLAEIAPTGVLRAGINMSNFLLVTGRGENDEPQGVSPDMAKAIADELGLELQLVPYNGPGELADAVNRNEWDIGNIAAEAERAKSMTFSHPYCEIQACYLVPAHSAIKTIEEVDQPGVSISVKERAAYDLWLTDNLRHATLVKTSSMDASFDAFVEQQLDVLAGLRPRLLKDAARLTGSRVLEGRFTSITQSIACPQGRPLAAAFIESFVAKAIESGFVATAIERHGVVGELSVAQAVAS